MHEDDNDKLAEITRLRAKGRHTPELIDWLIDEVKRLREESGLLKEDPVALQHIENHRRLGCELSDLTLGFGRLRTRVAKLEQLESAKKLF